MPRARVKFKPPQDTPFGLFAFTAERPDDEFRILSNHLDGDGLVVILEATMGDPGALVRLFDDAPAAIAHEVLHRDERTVLVQYRLPFVPPPYRALLASGNLPQLPHEVRDGWIVCELTTSHARLGRYRDELEATGFRFEVVSVTQSTRPTELLTDRQRQLLTAAHERGYYDSPRRCSLTELADDLGISKSTASTVLHDAEGVVVGEFLAAPVE